MGSRACDPLVTHDVFIGLGLLRKEHLYKGPWTGQEDGLLTQPSKYFSYLLVTNRIYLLSSYFDQKVDDHRKGRLKRHTRGLPLGIRNLESRSETSQDSNVTGCKY